MIFLLFVSAVIPEERHSDQQVIHVKEAEKQEKDTIRALLYSKASDYFIYKGVPIGFQYELLNIMGKNLGKVMDIEVENDPEKAYNAIFNNEYDIVALDYLRNPLLDFYLSHSTPHSTSHAVLIENRGKKEDTAASHLLYVPEHFPSHFLIDSFPKPFLWETVSYNDMTTEELFEKLQKSEIQYLVCDYNEAVTLLPFYTDLKMVKQIGPEYNRQWTLNASNVELNHTINDWLENFLTTPQYKKLCSKYLSHQSPVIKQSFKKSALNQISPFDKIIKAHAAKFHVDWRFITSIMYQESKFQCGLTGMGGSFGLMQMMPVTGERFGVNEDSSPEEQIRAGVRYLAYLEKMFSDIEDEAERMKFMAGAYNSGPGHIQDAQRLCEKYGLNPYVWDNVARYLALKSKSLYSKDPVVKHGYYPGNHTIKYVNQVMDRYQAYLIAVNS